VAEDILRSRDWTSYQVVKFERSNAEHPWLLGYREASEFIAKNGRLLVTFAELTLQGLRVPYTTKRVTTN